MRHPALVTVSVLLGLSLAGGAWLLHTRLQVRSQLQNSISQLNRALQQEQERSTGLALENELLRKQLAERGIVPAAPRAQLGKGPDEARRLEAIRELTQAQTRLSAAAGSITELQNRVAELEASVERAAAENKRLAALESASREDLENTRSILHAMEGEIKAKNERLSQLEAALRRSREDLAALTQRSVGLPALSAEISDVNRRRENIVTNLQRRYRDITDQLRALAVRLDTQRDNPAAAVGDISRIQTAVLSAEEDLRQLSALNSQAQRLMQKLGAR